MGYLVGFFVGFGVWLIIGSIEWRLPKSSFKFPNWAVSSALVFVIVAGLWNLSVWLTALFGVTGFFIGDHVRKWSTGESIKKQKLQDSLLLPNLIDLLAISLTAGLSLKAALENAVPKTDKELQRIWSALVNTDIDSSFAARLEKVSRSLPGSASSKLADQLLISIERGTPLLPMLDAIATDVRSSNYRALHEKAAAKDVWMMLPVVFGILPAVTAIAIYPALTTLSNI